MSQLKKRCIFILVAILFLPPSFILETPVSYANEEQPEFKNLAEGIEYTWSEDPNPAYPDDGFELTDGKYASDDLTDPGWQGHSRHPQKMTRSVVFDLGEKKSIGEIKARFLQTTPQGIYFPEKVTYSVSTNGVAWGDLAEPRTKIPSWKKSTEALTQFLHGMVPRKSCQREIRMPIWCMPGM